MRGQDNQVTFSNKLMPCYGIRLHQTRGIAWLIGLQLLFSTLLHAEDNVSSHESGKAVCGNALDRPCVALVLGGGGARGSAHIGVLRALEEKHIPIDLIVGTSIGSFVGGLYATGKSPDEIEQLFSTTNWNDGYRDNIGRDKIPNRRKRQLDQQGIHLDLGFDGDSVSLPQGFLQGQGMKALVDSMLGVYPRFKSFNQLPVPFRAVAADAETGEEVVLESGDLATALQISMSLPGVLRPIEFNRRLLVDGGVANNLPVSVAKSLGADIVIAVNIGSPTMTREELSSGLTILRQLTAFLVHKNVDYQRSLLSVNDLYMEPDIEGIGTLGFDRTLEAIEAGYTEATAKLVLNPDILALGSEDQSAKLQHIVASETSFHINTIKVTNHSRLGEDYILDRMQLTPGNTYTPEEIHEGIDRLYGQGSIARVNSAVWHTDVDSSADNSNSTTDTALNKGDTTLGIYVEEKEWGPGYLDFKLSVEDDFSSFSRYQLGGTYRLTNLSPYGAEWYSGAEFGTNKSVFTDLYWPLGTSGFFLNANSTIQRNVRQYSIDEISLGETTTTQGLVLGGIGWNSLDRFDTQISLVHARGELKLPDLLAVVASKDKLDYHQSGLRYTLNYDTLDHATFPKHGIKLDTALQRTRDNLEDLRNYSTELDMELNIVGSLGRNTLRGLLRYQGTINEDPLSLLGSFELGGFLNLSGNSPGSFSGQHVRFASLVYTYELAENDFGAIDLPLYLGFSAEAGNAWNNKSDIDYGDLIHSGSLFIGWDSPIGPAYLAYGQSDTKEKSLYLFIGVVF